MIKNYLLISWRSMMKNKFFIFINVVGLSLAIACCIVAYFNWAFDAEFDRHHSHTDQIYRVSSAPKIYAAASMNPVKTLRDE